MSSHFPIALLDALGGSPLELVIVVVAILVLFGAKSLPGTLRTLGRWSEQLKRISRELQQEISDAGEPFQEARKEWDEAAESLRVNQTDSSFAARPEPIEDAEEIKKDVSDAE